MQGVNLASMTPEVQKRQFFLLDRPGLALWGLTLTHE